MSHINDKIKAEFPDLAVMKNEENRHLFSGRTSLPSFLKDYLLSRFCDENGVVDHEKLAEYLTEKMPDRLDNITKKLLAGEQVNITVRIVVKADISSGRTTFTIPDAGIDRNAFISQKLLDESGDDLTDGEHWGNITLNYVTPQGNRMGYVEMVTFKSFEPYKIDSSYYYNAREHFSIQEWIDALITFMEYNPDAFDTEEQKLEFISRLLILVQPRLNIIELGPKGTGKSYVYNNISKHVWLHSGGRTTRAKMFYNKATKQFGLMRNHDAVIIDEVSTFTFSEPDEMQSIFKGYLESGQAKVDDVLFLSECGVGLSGNITLTSEKVPSNSRYFEKLPDMFRESATMDRFHGFIEGWKLPRLDAGSIVEGWTLNAEYFSAVMHNLRQVSDYETLFNQLVTYEETTDLRDLKAVRKLATAYAKLLFPHVRKLDDLADEDVDQFRQLYRQYCLEPAVRRRAIIREQCHYIDPEFHKEMPEFIMKQTLE